MYVSAYGWGGGEGQKERERDREGGREGGREMQELSSTAADTKLTYFPQSPFVPTNSIHEPACSGNTNAAVIMVAEAAADLIKASWKATAS